MTLFSALPLLAACATGGPAVSADPALAAPAAAPAAAAPAAGDPPPITAATDAEKVALRDGNAAFAFDLYRELVGEGAENLLISPFSVTSALAMTRAGAVGETGAEMDKALHFTLEGKRLHQTLFELQNSLDDDGQPWSLAIDNHLWPQQGLPLVPEFTVVLAAWYGMLLTQLDFGAPEAARTTINTWVSDHTQQRIPELIPQGVLDPSTTLVLTNAVWFKGSWQDTFDAAQTAPAPFTTAGGAQVEVPLMFRKGTCAWGQTADTTLLALPYAGERLEMLLALPDAHDGLPALEAQLSPATLAAWDEAMRPVEVQIWLPRFTLSSDHELSLALTSLGMLRAFGGGADFSGITTAAHIYIGAVLHQAWIAVDEQGTEAVAATAVVMKRGGGPRPTFRADHPFLFLIRDRQTGAILFLGRYTTPG